MQFDTLLCGSVSQAAWIILNTPERWAGFRQVHEADLKAAERMFSEIQHPLASSLRTLAAGQSISPEEAQLLGGIFQRLDPKPPTMSPVAAQAPAQC